MTLNDIIVAALAQLDRGHDRQTMDTWSGKLTRYVNEAVYDLAMTLRPRRADALEITDNNADTATLPRCCVKLLSLHQHGRRVPFYTGQGTSLIRVNAPDGTALAHYEYIPPDILLPTDVPELPLYCHGLIVTFAVARERASAEPNTQRGANLYFQLYYDAKKRLRAMCGEDDSYSMMNRW